MASLKYQILVILFLPFSIAFGQQNLVDKLSKLEIEQKPFNNYLDKNGKTIGCNWNLECTGFSVVFYSAIFNQNKSEIKLKGRTTLPSHNRIDSLDKVKYGDTVALGGVSIFPAIPVKNILEKIADTTFTSYYDDKPYAQFPFREGDFDITIKVVPNSRLYFVGFNHRLVEYDIGKLAH